MTSPEVTAAYVGHAFDQMLAVAEQVGDRLHDRPLGPSTNAIGALIFHCCEVVEFWVGHVALGRPTSRDRDAEFSTVLPLDELRRKVDATIAQLDLDLVVLAGGGGRPSDLRAVLLADGTDESVALHLVEELFQHLGQIELTADVLVGDRQERTAE